MQQPWRDLSAESRADLAACRTLLRGGSRSFHAASLLLPQRVAEPACALYAFCRLADDAIDRLADDAIDRPADDEIDIEQGRVAALGRLRERLARAYDGKPLPIAADRAFADVIARHAIPRALPDALLEGFEWDAIGRRYASLAELQAYAMRVAGSVGAMMALLMGVRGADALARACDLGVAMQLTNIARDVGEDARAGRLYLPIDWLAEAGIDSEALLRNPVFSPALGGVVRRLIDTADVLYRRAESGIAALPLSARSGIATARFLYAEIGREVERQGFDSITRRAIVSPTRKLAILARGISARGTAAGPCHAPPLDAARFLLDAIAAAPAPHAAPRHSMQAKFVRVFDLFARLDTLDASGQAA